ncbi:MAG: gephyrin-like molybdotransferase Glp [Burkholderiaceae bacterium]
MTDTHQTLSLDAVTGELPQYNPDALPVDMTRQIIETFVQPVQAIEMVALRAALGRVLASDLLSPIDVPPHDNSAMDGFAVRADDVNADGVRLAVIGTVMAGETFDQNLQPGQAVRIMTGAPMPTGADTVVPQELAEREGDTVTITQAHQPGQHRRLRGEDLAAGKPAIPAGKCLSPADLGLIASLGIAEVPVRRRIRVAFFSTGNELCSIGQVPQPGQVYDANRYTIFGLLQRLGVDLIDMGVIPDDPGMLENAVRTASESADAIISSGGVSVGEADFTRDIMNKLGDVRFWTIAMRPGRPMAFGRIGNAIYFGLPGNPVAVMVTFYFFARHALRRLMGANPLSDAYVRAIAAESFKKRPGRTEYQRGLLRFNTDGRMTVTATGSQGSGVLRSMSEANCIVVLHHDQQTVAAGGEVDCIPFDGLV